MRVVVFGYQTWGHRVLEALIASEHEISLVVTHPKADGEAATPWDDSVEDLAGKHGLPILLRNYPKNDDEELIGRLREADIAVASNWRTKLPSQVFGAPRLGTLNTHDSLLPKYAGFAPLSWALINGENEVGVTSHFMDEGLDTGAIVLQKPVTVGPKDTVTDLFHRTVSLFGPLILESLDLIGSGRTGWVAQDLDQASFFHKRSTEENRIDWTWPAADIANLVRAQVDPYPNAFTFRDGERLRILAASVSAERYGGTPGRVMCRQGAGVVIVAGPDARRGRNHGLVIEQLRTDDGREYSGGEFFQRLGGYLTAQP